MMTNTGSTNTSTTKIPDSRSSILYYRGESDPKPNQHDFNLASFPHSSHASGSTLPLVEEHFWAPCVLVPHSPLPLCQAYVYSAFRLEDFSNLSILTEIFHRILAHRWYKKCLWMIEMKHFVCISPEVMHSK